MKVVIFGATGQVGRQLVIHALAKGWKVVAFGRNAEALIDRENEQFKAFKGYVLSVDDVAKALEGADAVLSALGGSFDGTDKSRSVGIKNIAAGMKKHGVRRLVALGGLGVLPTPDGGYLMDGEDYPTEYLPVGNEHRQAYLNLQASGLDWTFVCSPNIIDKDADNAFEVEAEAPAGAGEISTGNLALFMVEELERNEYVGKRVGIGNLEAAAQ